MYKWVVNNKQFRNRKDCLLYCNENHIDIGESEFFVPTLPSTVVEPENLNLFDAASPMLQEFKDSGKKIILLYSGGPDSTLVLNCFLENNIAPDVIVVYTADFFDGNSPFNPYIVETEQAKEYLYSLKKKNALLNNTEIREIVQGKEYQENFYENVSWPRKFYGIGCGVESSTSWFHHPQVEDDNAIVIRGGATPGVFSENNEIYLYYVDVQSGEAVTGYNNSIDFITYNKNFFSAYASSLIKNTSEFNTRYQDFQFGDKNYRKFNIPEIKDKINQMPQCIPKKPRSLNSEYLFDDLISKVNTVSMKNWIVYLESLRLKPKWFDYYCDGINNNKEWVDFYRKSPGILSKPILFEPRKN